MCVRERSTAVSFIFCLIRLLRALALFPLYGLATVVGFAVVVVVATAVFFVIIGTRVYWCCCYCCCFATHHRGWCERTDQNDHLIIISAVNEYNI